jgi:hypothetical protein
MRSIPWKLRLPFLLAMLLACSPVLRAQTPAPAEPSDTKLDDIVKETQKQIGGKNIAGLVWWIPAEFWEQSAIQEGSTPTKARETFAPLREYTMVIVAVGKWDSGISLGIPRAMFAQTQPCATLIGKPTRQ